VFAASEPQPEPANPAQDQPDPGPPPGAAAAESPQPPFSELFSLDPAAVTDDRLQDIMNRHVTYEVAKAGFDATHTVLVLHDDHSLQRYAADRIYEAIAGSDTSRPLLLILNSSGGDVAAAYLISKLCREHTRATFEVAVPRRAKSAATLICCGADKIHMGSLSELGPIDPQFGAIPALALKHSVEHMAQLVNQYPAASAMFSDYLAKSLRVEALGYFERVAESAVQYAVRLLGARTIRPAGREDDQTAHRLVYSYKDHGFVIDSREATEIFGPEIVVSNTKEYQLASTLFSALDLAGWVCGRRYEREFSYVGGLKQGCMIWKKTA
jgi:hypothetical protein